MQTQLRSNVQGRRKRPPVVSSSILAGMLWTADGNRFTPSHTVKKGRRYRYYICQPVRQPGGAMSGPYRLPAHQIETLVLSRLKSFLHSANDVIDSLSLPADSASIIHQLIMAAQGSSGKWFAGAASGTGAVLTKFVDRVVVHQEKVEVLIRGRRLRNALIHELPPGSSPDPSSVDREAGELVHLSVDARLKHCGGEVRFVVPPRSTAEMPTHQVPSLLKAVVRGHDWRTQIIEGRVWGRRTLSKQTGLDERYVSRILQCAFLAPDIVESILDGQQPADFSLEKLRNGVPLSWVEQRQRFGFPSRP